MKPKKYSLDIPLHHVSSSDDTVLLALNPEFTRERGIEYISWHDPINHRMFQLKSTSKDTESVFSWKDGEGTLFTMRPMTLDVYNKRVKSKLVGGRAFRTEATMIEWFTKGLWVELYG